MTVLSTIARNDYIGAGTVGPFPYAFRIFAATDLVVVKTDASGNVIPLAYITDYTVTGVGQGGGGSITLAAVLPVGYTLTIKRVLTVTQPTDFRNQTSFYGDSHEDALDRLVMIAQAQQEQLSHAVSLPSTLSGVSAQLPAPTPNLALFWKADASGLENRPIPGNVAVTLPGAGRVTPDLTSYLANNAVVNPYDFGALGRNSGTDTDGAKFLLAQTAAGANGQIDGYAGTFQIETNLNFSQYYNPRRGHVLRPRAGININFGGGIADVYFQFIDLSLGGTISFSGPLEHARAEWVGMKADNANADWIPLTLLTNMIPKWTKVKFRPGSNIRLDYAWPITLQQGCVFECPIMPTDAWNNTTNCIFHWAGPAGGSMVLDFSNGYCRFIGVAFDPGAVNTAAVCVDTDHVYLKTSASSTAVQSQAANTAGGTLGAKFFKSLAPNIQIALSTAGVAGGTLTTSLQSVTDDQHATLAAPATSASQFCQATYSPAGYAAPPNPSNRISTQSIFEFVQFLCIYGQAGRLNETIGHRISASAQANAEYNVHRHCQFWGTDLTQAAIPQNGNNNGRAYFNTPGGQGYPGTPQLGAAAPTSSNMMTAGSNAIGGFSVDTFSPGMNGMRWRGPGGTADLGARGYSGTSDTDHTKALDGYFKYLSARTGALYSDAGLTTPLNAVTTVTKASPYFMLGETVGVGLQVGPSFNSKRHSTYECHFSNLAIGVDLQGGSIHQILPNYSNNEINARIGVAQSEPSSEYGANSENSRCHLFFGSPQSYTLEKSRLAMGMVSPNDSYFKFVAGAGAPLVRFIDFQVENYVPSSSTMFGWSLSVASPNGGTGVSQPCIVEGARLPDVDSLSALGWDSNALSNSTIIYQRANSCSNAPTLLPGDSIITTTQTGMFNGQPFQYRRGTTFFANQYTPQTGDFLDVPGWAFYSANDAGSKPRVLAAFKDSSPYLNPTLGLEVTGYKSVTDGANISIDPRQARFFFLNTTQASPNFQAIPGWSYEGQEFFLMLKNSSGGALTPTWPSWHMSAGITYPANGKFRFYHFIILDGVVYEKRWDSDIS